MATTRPLAVMTNGKAAAPSVIRTCGGAGLSCERRFRLATGLSAPVPVIASNDASTAGCGSCSGCGCWELAAWGEALPPPNTNSILAAALPGVRARGADCIAGLPAADAGARLADLGVDPAAAAAAPAGEAAP